MFKNKKRVQRGFVVCVSDGQVTVFDPPGDEL